LDRRKIYCNSARNIVDTAGADPYDSTIIFVATAKNIPGSYIAREETMVAVKTTLKAASAEIQVEACSDCHGTGTIRYSNEVSNFEDLRSCPSCKAGHAIESTIAEIVARAQAEERFPRRHR
jgi:hypothetical protein